MNSSLSVNSTLTADELLLTDKSTSKLRSKSVDSVDNKSLHSKRHSSRVGSHEHINVDDFVLLDDLVLCNVPLDMDLSRKPAEKDLQQLAPQDRDLSIQLNRLSLSSPLSPDMHRRMDDLVDPLPLSKEKQSVLSVGRPSWLPPKSKEEERRHMQEFEQIRKAAERLERQRRHDAQRVAEKQKARYKQLVVLWEQKILRHWPESLTSSKVKDVWWEGIPARVRGRAWQRAIGNELQLGLESFSKACENARHRLAADEEQRVYSVNQFRDDESAFEVDIVATMPELKLFQRTCPLHQDLLNVLQSYSYYRFDTSYVPGTSYVAALFLLNMNQSFTFNSLANLLDKPLQQSVFGASDSTMLDVFCQTFLHVFRREIPQLMLHLHTKLDIDVREYVHPILRSFFVPMVSHEIASRFMDCYLFEGDCFFIQVLLAAMNHLQSRLYVLDTHSALSVLTNSWQLDDVEKFLAAAKSYVVPTI
ncbi:GTPase activating protein [Schizosaccharomyces japonicus yFS275]|uniref:GTPase activating protein n=1 Tax=Schizosaccharomyces japonicus (strain yFS275 / FY16936) TaxID=402676 RepID=B6JX86_SCHJY|nr:GTPase activating protein [Schizosaccharomyces japonicus yFS275]EEB05987.1 GTPase activating protein [Schizosaccharomyces japonicus yFS275]